MFPSFLGYRSLMHLDLDTIPDRKFSWSHLTTLCLENLFGFITVSDILPILSQLQRVERLAFGRLTSNLRRTQDILITLSCLKVLKSRGHSLLWYIRAPVLEELHVYESFLSSTITFLQKSCCNVRRLAIGNGFPLDFERIVRLVPGVANASFGPSEMSHRSWRNCMSSTDFTTPVS